MGRVGRGNALRQDRIDINSLKQARRELRQEARSVE